LLIASRNKKEKASTTEGKWRTEKKIKKINPRIEGTTAHTHMQGGNIHVTTVQLSVTPFSVLTYSGDVIR